jgi:hypothetical protein
LYFAAKLGKVQTSDHQIQNLLKREHLTIYKSTILGKISYASQTPSSGSVPYMVIPLTLVTSRSFATQLHCNYREYCNTVPAPVTKFFRLTED